MTKLANGRTPRIMARALLAGYLLCALTTSGVEGQERVDVEFGSLNSTLEALRDSMAIEGVSAALILPDGTLWAGQAGEGAPGVAVEAATVFDGGSTAKMFTAAVLLQLAAEGAVDLDAPLARWLPDLPNADQVTPRMLLNHTSGWADAWSDRSLVPRLVSAPMKRWTPAEVLAATPPPTSGPGEAWGYSSSGYVALGLVAEAATGAPFGTLLRERLFDPLRLTRTVHGAYEDPAEPLAHAWLDIDGDGTPEDFTALLPAVSWRTAAGPAGAIITNATELAIFTRAFVTGELVSGQAAAAPRGEWVERPDGNQHGLGLLGIDLGGTRLLGHRGNAAGYSAAAWHAPETGITIVVMTNKHAFAVTPIVARLLEVVASGNAREPSRGGATRPRSRPLLVGLQPAVTVERAYDAGSFDINLLPVVLQVPLGRRADVRLTAILNHHFGDDSQLSHAGGEIALPLFLAARSAGPTTPPRAPSSDPFSGSRMTCAREDGNTPRRSSPAFS